MFKFRWALFSLPLLLQSHWCGCFSGGASSVIWWKPAPTRALAVLWTMIYFRNMKFEVGVRLWTNIIYLQGAGFKHWKLSPRRFGEFDPIWLIFTYGTNQYKSVTGRREQQWREHSVHNALVPNRTWNEIKRFNSTKKDVSGSMVLIKLKL